MVATSLGRVAPGAQTAPNHSPKLLDCWDLLGSVQQGDQRGGGLVGGKPIGGRFAVARSSCWG
jgi:hypothetical protein